MVLTIFGALLDGARSRLTNEFEACSVQWPIEYSDDFVVQDQDLELYVKTYGNAQYFSDSAWCSRYVIITVSRLLTCMYTSIMNIYTSPHSYHDITMDCVISSICITLYRIAYYQHDTMCMLLKHGFYLFSITHDAFRL